MHFLQLIGIVSVAAGVALAVPVEDAVMMPRAEAAEQAAKPVCGVAGADPCPPVVAPPTAPSCLPAGRCLKFLEKEHANAISFCKKLLHLPKTVTRYVGGFECNVFNYEY